VSVLGIAIEYNEDRGRVEALKEVRTKKKRFVVDHDDSGEKLPIMILIYFHMYNDCSYLPSCFLHSIPKPFLWVNQPIQGRSLHYACSSSMNSCSWMSMDSQLDNWTYTRTTGKLVPHLVSQGMLFIVLILRLEVEHM